MNKVIKYFLIIINIYCVCALIFYITLWYKNTLISENIKITYNNIVNDGDEYYNHEKLYEYVFSLYDNILLIDKNNFSVENFNYDGNVYVKESFFYPLTKKEQKLVKVVSDIYTDGNFKDDEKIGDVIVSLNDKEIYREDIYVTTLKKSEKKENFFVYKTS